MLSRNTTIIPLRDDTGQRSSMSNNERNFIQSCALSGVTRKNKKKSSLRLDGRNETDIRKVRLKFSRWDNGSECTIQWGVGTRVTAICSAELTPPSSPDRPNEGIVNFSIDVSPMAGTSFRHATIMNTTPKQSGGSSGGGGGGMDHRQRLLSNRILRSVERIIIIGGALDTEALVLVPGQWVWRFNISMTVLDNGGNLIDACTLAAVAALKHYRKPHVNFSDGIIETSGRGGDGGGEKTEATAITAASLPTIVPSTVKEATPLPLHHTPLSLTFALISASDVGFADTSSTASSMSLSAGNVAMLADPSDREELVQSGSLTIAMNTHGEVCMLDYGGGCELLPSKLKDCFKIAQTSIQSLCTLLEDALTKADLAAQEQRMERLRNLQESNNTNSKNAGAAPSIATSMSIDKNNTNDSIDSTIFIQQQNSNTNDDAMMMMEQVSKDVNESMKQVETEAEEKYRLQALDYATGHIANQVRDDSDDYGQNTSNKNNKKKVYGSLLQKLKNSIAQGGSIASSSSTTTRTVSSKQSESPKSPKLSLPPKPTSSSSTSAGGPTKKPDGPPPPSSSFMDMGAGAGGGGSNPAKTNDDDKAKETTARTNDNDEKPSSTSPSPSSKVKQTSTTSTTTTAVKTNTSQMTTTTTTNNDDDIDLAMAVKKKKKKSKKK